MEKPVQFIFQLPDLAFRTAPVGGRVEDDRVVAVAAADLAVDEFTAVVDKIADRRVRKAGEGGVLMVPGHHTPRGVDVGHRGARHRGRDGRPAGIGKEVEDADLTAPVLFFCGADQTRKPVPVRGLFRKEPGVLKGERFQAEPVDIIAVCGRIRDSAESPGRVRDIPRLRQLADLPGAAAGILAVVDGVRTFPAPVFLFGLPDDLRVRADKDIVSPALQTFAA